MVLNECILYCTHCVYLFMHYIIFYILLCFSAISMNTKLALFLHIYLHKIDKVYEQIILVIKVYL